MDGLVAVGELLRPYGLRGELRVRALTDRPRDRFAALSECFVVDPVTSRRERRRIASHRFEGDGLLVRLEGVESPEEARRIQGFYLSVAPDEVLPPPEGHFYPWQLEGARVETTDGRLIGRFARVEGTPEQAIWVVLDGDREHLIPAVPEIVIEVSVADRRVVIDPPEGLLDLSVKANPRGGR